MALTVYTSYFDRLSLLPRNLIPVSIALVTPDRFFGYKYPRLNPTGEILMHYRKTGDVDKYVHDFNEQILGKLNQESVMRELGWLCGKGEEPCLLCYEPPGMFCHRHLVAEWLKKSGYEVKEWKLS